MLFSFTEEDTVLDLRNRVAMACKVSVEQFVLVFQSRTLQSSVKVVCTGVQRGHTFYMQGALKGGCKGKDSWVSGIVLRVEPRWFDRLGHLVSREMVLGTLLRCLKAFERVKIIFAPQSVPIRGTGNGLGRTQRNQSSGCRTARASSPQPGPININNKGWRNKQEEPLLVPDPLQTLTQVIQLLQTLPLDPSVKDHLRDSLQGHVAPMLQPKKSTAELIHEKQTERADEESARVTKQNKYDLLMTNVQKILKRVMVMFKGWQLWIMNCLISMLRFNCRNRLLNRLRLKGQCPRCRKCLLRLLICLKLWQMI